MAVEVVAPVSPHALQPLALDDPLDAAHEICPAFAIGFQRRRKIDAAGELQRGKLACLCRCRCLA
jgi:hypothetical protein